MESPRPTEDQFTKTIESYTAAIPSSGYLAVAIGAMGLSLAARWLAEGNGATLSPSGCLRGCSSACIISSLKWKAMTDTSGGTMTTGSELLTKRQTRDCPQGKT